MKTSGHQKNIRVLKKTYRWLLPAVFGVLLLQIGCKNESGISEGDVSPTITSTNPLNNATDVPVNTFITVIFDEEMDPSTISDSSFTLKLDSVSVDGIVNYDDSLATFIPSTDLLFGRTYTVTVTSKVQNLSGSSLSDNYEWQFTTVSEQNGSDSASPKVSSTNPKNNDKNVSTNTTISATFSEPIKASTINSGTFFLANGANPVSGNVTYSNTTATASLSATLEFETTYTVTISGDIEDTAGNSLGDDYTWSFTTGAEPDNDPPKITETKPADNENDVPVSTIITATFDEPINRSTIDNSTFFLERNNTRIPGSFSFSGNSVSLTPSNTLSFEQSYTATLTTGIEDMAGNSLASRRQWKFTTGDEPDDEGPEIDSKNPNNNQSNVDIGTNISVNFSEAINPSTINSTTFFLRDNNTRISASYNTSANTVTLNPSGNLSYETTYSVTLTTGIEDLAGNELEDVEIWQFTTEDPPDIIAPEIDATNPANGATDVPLDVVIRATFNEPVNGATFNDDSFILTQDGDEINGDVSLSSSNTAQFIPKKDLELGTTYVVTITDDVEDLAGNKLDNDFEWSFTTEQESVAPRVDDTDPDNGATNVPMDVELTVTFNELMNSFSVNENSFILSQNGSRIEGNVSFFTTTTARFTPDNDLDPNTVYTATVTTDVTDLVGNNMENDYVWTFTTEQESIPPRINDTNPNSGQTDVSTDIMISVTFNEAIDAATVNNSSFFVSLGSTSVSGDVDSWGNPALFTFTPSTNLEFNATYTVTLTTDIQDLAGNALENDFSWNFTTESINGDDDD